MKPFLKWAGNKYQIINRIKNELPEGKDRLIEPFVGSGAVFLNTNYPECFLADANQDLIRLYQHIQSEGQDFIEYCQGFFKPENNQKDAYLEFRKEFNQTEDSRLKSALFLYLNKHAFNGLCRYNASGKFNVPFGRYDKPYFPKEEMLYFYEKSQNATFAVQDFRITMASAKLGDVIYCDPPYEPLNETANFTSYAAGGFGRTEQMALAELAQELAGRDIPVIISNHETPFTMEAYQTARIVPFDVQRFISCDGANRKKVGEVLAVFGEEPSYCGYV